MHEVFLRGKPCNVALEKVSDDAVGGASGIRNRGTVVPSKRGCVFNQVRWNRAGWFDAILPPSQTVHLSTLLCALDRAASLGARNREAVRAGDMGKGLALI